MAKTKTQSPGSLQRSVRRRPKKGDRVRIYCYGYPAEAEGTIVAMRRTSLGTMEATIEPDSKPGTKIYLHQNAMIGFDLIELKPPNDRTEARR
jgi:hypothetical protein